LAYSLFTEYVQKEAELPQAITPSIKNKSGI
jgi:hypothetical protein